MSASIPLLVMNVIWLPSAILATLLIAYFPDGQLHGRGWRWIPGCAAAATAVLMTASAIDAWPTADWVAADAPAPLGLLFLVGGLLTLAIILGGAASFTLRWRGEGDGRRSFEVVGGALIIGASVSLISYPWAGATVLVPHAAFGVFLGAYGVAVSRYRLHDFEPVFGKRLAARTVSLVLVGAYLGVLVAVGAVISQRTASPVIPLVVVAVAAVARVPAHQLVLRAVERLLYGQRAERVEVLSRMAASQVGGREQATMTDLAELVRRGTGATRVEIDVPTESGLRLTTAGSAARLEDQTPDSQPQLVRYARAQVTDGESQGEIRVYALAAADLLADAESVLRDVAHLLSVLLENARLSRVLTQRLEQTHASRLRLVQAQDQARRALERDIHDGAQAQLIAIRMHLGEIERTRGAGGVPGLTARLSHVGHEVDGAIRQLRDLARGLHPPTLTQLGTGPAVQAFIRDAALPVAFTLTGDGRHPQATESAAYFACIEAIQNALRHARNSTIAVAVSTRADELRFTVSDTGPGFDPASAARNGLSNVTDRIAAVGGSVDIWSAPGAGTRVTATIPAGPSQTAQDTAVHQDTAER